MRIFYIILANISLPFLIFYLFQYSYKIFMLIANKKHIKIKKLSGKSFSILIFIGLILLASFLFTKRLNIKTETRDEIYKVKEYNFRN